MPLAETRAALSLKEHVHATEDQKREAAAMLMGTNLGKAELAHANLSEAQLTNANLSEAQMMGVYLFRAQLTNANLSRAQLTGANLSEAQLERANLSRAQLKRAYLSGAQLEHANLSRAQLEGADLSWAQLMNANLGEAQLMHANLNKAQLTDAYLFRAQLTGAYLRGAQLTNANLDEAQLTDAYLHLAFFDSATTLNDVTLSDSDGGTAKVADLRWDGVNLSVIAWDGLIAEGLGDEQAAWQWKFQPFTRDDAYAKLSRKGRAAVRRRWQEGQATARLQAFQKAVRANRQVATALRDQGMNEQADQFAYRAQVVQRRVYRLQGNSGRALFSWFLDAVAGHGYKPVNSLWTYLGVLLSFAVLFFLAGNGWLTFGLAPSQYQGLPWYEALILSVSSFHGRGFFQPLQTLGDPVAIIASVEAVFGLFIEVAFIATFTQRFFGK